MTRRDLTTRRVGIREISICIFQRTIFIQIYGRYFNRPYLSGCGEAPLLNDPLDVDVGYFGLVSSESISSRT